MKNRGISTCFMSFFKKKNNEADKSSHPSSLYDFHLNWIFFLRSYSHKKTIPLSVTLSSAGNRFSFFMLQILGSLRRLKQFLAQYYRLVLGLV